MVSEDNSRQGKFGDVMRVADLARRPGLVLESRNDRLSPEDPLFRGRFWNRELRRGLALHGSDVVEDEDFVATSVQTAGLTLVFFLEGEVDIEIGDRRFQFNGAQGVRDAILIPAVRDESFRRISHGRQKLRHLVISVSPEWLDRDGLATVSDHRLSQGIIGDHLGARRWTFTPRVADLVSRLMTTPAESGALADLRLEGAAIEVMAEALSAASHQDVAEQTSSLSPSELARLRRAEDFIAALGSDPARIQEIAREAGVSVTGLQRLFKAAHGASVLDHVRRVRLDQAHDALAGSEFTVQRAAALAGYGSAANFATAFRRQFGYSPSQARDRIPR